MNLNALTPETELEIWLAVLWLRVNFRARLVRAARMLRLDPDLVIEIYDVRSQ